MYPVFTCGGENSAFVIGVDISVSESSLPHSLDHRDVSFRKSDMLIVKLVEEFGPPLLVILAFKEFLELVLLRQFTNSFTFDGVSLMLVQIVPVFGNVACTDQNFLI